MHRKRCMGGFASQSVETGRSSTVGWWSQSGSNRRPPACKAGALPAELWPQRGRSVDRRLGGIGNYWMQVTCADAWTGKCLPVSKGGDPAAPSDTATLLRLHPSHESHRGNRPPEG